MNAETNAPGEGANEQVALYVDLDGTLVSTDLLYESFLGSLRKSPWILFKCAIWLLRGRTTLKRELARASGLDVKSFPYRKDVLAFLREERDRGRRLVLATASWHSLAEEVANHLGIFSQVLATDDGRNLKGAIKREAIERHAGDRGYHYIGDSRADMVVWEGAKHAYVVDHSGRLAGIVAERRSVEKVFPASEREGLLRPIAQAIRIHQWTKNVLLFAPLVASHQVGETASLTAAGLGFAAFCLLASSAYILNDLLDLESDRAHPRKRLRPFAAGALSIPAGLALSLLLLALGAAASSLLPSAFQVTLTAYFLITLAYSLALKRHALVDVIALASLYTIRIVAGTLVISAPLSFWLLAFAMFIFFSLALVKRYAELHALRQGENRVAPGRGYTADDDVVVLGLGTSSGLVSVLVLALYINGETVKKLYSHPDALWFLCPLLLYWISRIWLLATQGRMHDDPVLFAVRDRDSYAIALLGAVVLWIAT